MHVRMLLLKAKFQFYNAPFLQINLSDTSKMLAKQQLKYVDVPLDHTWKVPVLQEFLIT